MQESEKGRAQYAFRTGDLSVHKQVHLDDDFAICLCPKGASSISPGLDRLPWDN
jgi:hypothetical protein